MGWCGGKIAPAFLIARIEFTAEQLGKRAGACYSQSVQQTIETAGI
jgi:hypothetical protein